MSLEETVALVDLPRCVVHLPREDLRDQLMAWHSKRVWREPGVPAHFHTRTGVAWLGRWPVSWAVPR